MRQHSRMRTLTLRITPALAGRSVLPLPEAPFDVGRYYVDGAALRRTGSQAPEPVGIERDGNVVRLLGCRRPTEAGDSVDLYLYPKVITETGGSPGTYRVDA